MLPHLDSAHNLARWLLRSESDAQDVAQEALLRALRFFPGFHGGDPRAWLLKIVRNASYTWLESHRRAELSEEFDEERHGEPAASPEAQAIARAPLPLPAKGRGRTVIRSVSTRQRPRRA